MIALLAAGMARAQDEPPELPPVQIEPEVDPSLDALRQRPEEGQPLRAANRVRASVPGLDGGEGRVPRPVLLPEGTFITPRRGTVLRAGNGEWYVVFHPDEQGQSLPPMALLPSAVLEEIEGAASAESVEGSPRLTVRIAGQVFVYQRRNLLLPRAWSVVHSVPVQVSPGQAAPAEGAAPALDPSVSDLIAELETAGAAPRALDHHALASADARAGDGESAIARQRSASMIVRRRVRLDRIGGVWIAMPETGVKQPLADTPMVVMPSAALTRMETVAGARGDQVLFEISGSTDRYRGRTLLIPTFVRIVQAGDIAGRP